MRSHVAHSYFESHNSRLDVKLARVLKCLDRLTNTIFCPDTFAYCCCTSAHVLITHSSEDGLCQT